MNIRLGGGEYDGGEMATWEARMHFLDAVAEVRPEVLDALRDDVFPLYDSWGLLGPNDVHGDLRDALENWTKRFNLSFDWVVEAALVTLWSWFMVDPEALDEIASEWHHAGGGYWLHTSKEERRIIFKHAGWDPAGETRAGFRKRVMNDFAIFVERYMDELAGIVEERGLEKAKEARKVVHFTWAALRIVQGRSYREIADWHEKKNVVVLGEDAIRKAVDRVTGWLK